MPSSQMVTIGQVCKIIGGGTPSRTRPEFFGGNIPWATVKDFKSSVISRTEESITDAAVTASATNIVPPRTVLLVSRIGLGKVAIAGVDLAINQDVKALTPREDVLPEYLYWFLLSKAHHFVRIGVGATVKGITLGDIKAVEMSLPLIHEQQRIVDLLSNAESIVSLRREAQQKAAELVPAIFLEMFGDPAANPKGWPVVSLGEALAAADYGSSTKASDTGDGVPLIRMGNVGFDGNLNLSNLKYVQLADAAVEKYVLRKGDILFNRTNSKDLVGKTGLWDGGLHAVVASYFIRLRVDEGMLVPTYLWALMNGRHMKKVLFETARGAIGQANINSKELKAFRVALPPMPLQRTFEHQVETVQSICAQQANALTKADATFAALLSKAFPL